MGGFLLRAPDRLRDRHDELGLFHSSLKGFIIIIILHVESSFNSTRGQLLVVKQVGEV